MPPTSIGLAFNIYNDHLALPGLLENATSFFDDIVAIHAGPNGRHSTDGTIEILEQWGIRTVMSRIDDGFGTVRTQCIRESKAAWVMIMDADERFHPLAPMLRCVGTEGYPAVPNPDLTVTHEGGYNQGDFLRQAISTIPQKSIRACRRHWFDYSWKRPCQNWQLIPDHQLRIVKNLPEIHYEAGIKMHERLLDATTGTTPSFVDASDEVRGIFFDHYHCFWKPKEHEQRLEDIDIYNALHSGSTEQMWVTRGYK